ncbi:MAG: DUF1987 domain-containing protein [Candidatus Cyclobacteriaceae bacterium M2_1C_046]
MEKFFVNPTPKTPKIEFNPNTGEFLLEGRSIPENSLEFYRPLVEWLDRYLKTPNEDTILKVNLEYFNTSTSKCLVEIFRKLENLNTNKRVKIIWHYEEEDEDMMESGEDFKKIIKIPIEFKKVEEI